MDARIKRLTLGIILAGAFSPAFADGLLKVEQTVFGMDCAPCAYGAQKNLSKLSGVAKVDVSLNDGKAVIEFGPESATTLGQIRAVLIHGGLTPKEAQVTVEGRLVKTGGKLQLVVNTGEHYDLVVTQGSDAAALAADAKVIVQGEVAESTSDATPSLNVLSIKPAG
ncbi:MAG TPA: heavy-metal-associated domain-containing protein [Gammaproteobacteria bacterium]|nr:heavy-metal-associated domain-containing protein [Gammaproteobacteria bacterium]